jgi:hypothetical protein
MTLSMMGRSQHSARCLNRCHYYVECHFDQCRYAEYHHVHCMLSIHTLNVIMINKCCAQHYNSGRGLVVCFIMPSFVMLSFVMLSLTILNIFRLNFVILNEITLDVIILNVIILNVIMISFIMLSITVNDAKMLSVIMLSGMLQS